MSVTAARAYLSPTLVLLAFDWPDGEQRADFLGFAITRTPGFLDLTTGVLAASSLLPNRLSFNGPPAEGQPDFPSDKAPIQKFMWWDARLEGLPTGQSIAYANLRGDGDLGAPSGGSDHDVHADRRLAGARGARHRNLVQSRRHELAGLLAPDEGAEPPGGRGADAAAGARAARMAGERDGKAAAAIRLGRGVARRGHLPPHG